MLKKLEDFLNRLPPDTVESHLESIGVKIHRDKGSELVNLHYTVDAPKDNPITNTCRGVVMHLSQEGKFSLVSGVFPRFFNYKEVEGDGGFCWDSFRVEEKWDGTFTTMYHYAGVWNVSTRRTPLGGDYAPLYWEAFCRNGLRLEDHDPNLVYIRELITPENPIVVDYGDKWLLKDIALFSRETWEEIDLPDNVVSLPSDLPTLLEYLTKTSGKDMEGFILKDKDGKRLKLKAPNYVELHRALNNQNPDLRELWLSGDLDEFLLFFPSYNEKASLMLHKINLAVEGAKRLVEQWDGDFKEFALANKNNPYFHIAIMFLRNQTPFLDTIRKMPSSHFEKRFLK